MKRNHIITLLTLSTALFAASAVYAGQPDPINQSTKTVDLNFGKTTTFGHNLTAASVNFEAAIPDAKNLANGAISAGDAQAHKFAIRYTPAAAAVDATGLKAVINGKDVGTNQLKTTLVTGAASTLDNGYLAYNADAPNVSYQVNADGAQTVPTDTYVLSMDAAVWMP
ncbi:hypothetical protein [Serratia ureilytica]|uniref:hypothetical protein n=1 Tax=Serratia ureilytica TaxID=300181 RepID=UPI00313E14B4